MRQMKYKILNIFYYINGKLYNFFNKKYKFYLIFFLKADFNRFKWYFSLKRNGLLIIW